VLLPTETPKGLEPDLSSISALEEETVDRFDSLAAHRAGAAVLEALSPSTLRRPTSVEECKPHKEVEGVQRSHLPKLPGS
jgi:hypothetical protein